MPTMTSTVSVALNPHLWGKKKREAECVDRVGAWAITRAVRMDASFAANLYTVTHVGTGWAASPPCLPLSSARAYLRLLAAMPDQPAWDRLRNASRMTKTMKAAGRAVREQWLNEEG